MSSLAEPLHFTEPPASYLSSTSGSTIVKRLTWNGVSAETRNGYQTVIDSYKTFCMLFNLPAWPATSHTLEKWSANWIYGSNLSKQGQIKPDTVLSYLSELQAYHIDHSLPLDAFEGPHLAWIIKRGKKLFPQVKAKRLPITKDILQKITPKQPIMSIEDHNIDAAFKISWAGFL